MLSLSSCDPVRPSSGPPASVTRLSRAAPRSVPTGRPRDEGSTPTDGPLVGGRVHEERSRTVQLTPLTLTRCGENQEVSFCGCKAEGGKSK